MATVRVGALTVRHPNRLHRTPSGLVCPAVFRGDGARDYTDRTEQLRSGRDLIRIRQLVASMTVPFKPYNARPDQITAQEHAKACQELDSGPAGRRARELLFRYLSPSQLDTARRYDYFDVGIVNESLVKVCLELELPVYLDTIAFRIRRGFPNGNIHMGFPEEGRFRYTLCLHPPSPYPTDDICLAQMSMLTIDPEEFISKAGITGYGKVEEQHRFRSMFDNISQRRRKQLLLPFRKEDR